MTDNASTNTVSTNNTTVGQSKHAVVFHGKAGEYFSIWLVNALLTAITLGIYSAWATVRRRRYFYGNTEINGDRFDYHAEPIQILKGRLIVVGAIILFYVLMMISPLLGSLVLLAFVAVLPVLVIRNWRYNAIMTSYRGIRFNYLGDVKRAYWVLLGFPLLAGLGMVVLIALAGTSGSFIAVLLAAIVIIPAMVALGGVMRCMQADLYVNRMMFGNSAFKANLYRGAFIKIAFFSILVFLPFLIVGMWLAGSFFTLMLQGALSGANAAENLQGSALAGGVFSLVLAYLVFLIGGLVCSCYMVAAHRNYIYSQTVLDGNVQLHSAMKLLPYLGLLFTNSLIVLFSLGLATPVAHVRYVRFMAQATQLTGDLSLLHVSAHGDTARSAVAEEAIGALDINVGI